MPVRLPAKAYFKLGCVDSDNSTFKEFGDCKLGADFGNSTLGNDLAGTHTWFEVTWGCNETDYNTYCKDDPSSATCFAHCAENPSINPNTGKNEGLGATDYFDISVVDGYGVPMSVAASGDGTDQCGDGISSKDLGFLDLASCPSETSATLAVPESGDEAAIYTWLDGEQKAISMLSTTSNGYSQNCAHPHSWFSGNVLGTTITDDPRPIAPATSGSDCNSANWYGCANACNNSSGTAVTPSGGATQCQAGPEDGSKNVAKTNFVRRLKAMGITGYTWQFDDATGEATCPQGLTYTLTLCPLKAGQTPYDTSTQSWKFVSDSNSCTLADDGDDDTYTTYWDCISSNATYTTAVHTNVTYCVPDSGGEYANYAACAKTLDAVPDTQEDLIWRNTETGINAVWHLNGETVSSYKAIQKLKDQNWNIAGSFDFNNDGYSDLLWHNLDSGKNAIWYLKRHVLQSWVLIDDTANVWDPKGVGDFDNNGTIDIVWRNSKTGANFVWYMDDATRTGEVSLPKRELPWELGGVADFNSDDHPDLLWRNPDTGENDIWLMNGTTRTETVSLPEAETRWEIVGTMDANNRGQVDIIWRRPAKKQTGIWRMKGTSMASSGLLDGAPSSWEVQGTGVIY